MVFHFAGGKSESQHKPAEYMSGEWGMIGELRKSNSPLTDPSPTPTKGGGRRGNSISPLTDPLPLQREGVGGGIRFPQFTHHSPLSRHVFGRFVLELRFSTGEMKNDSLIISHFSRMYDRFVLELRFSTKQMKNPRELSGQPNSRGGWL